MDIPKTGGWSEITKKKRIMGIGSALVDILINEQDDFPEKVGALKGGMSYVDSRDIEKIIKMTSSQPYVVPGGSACNTVVGVGKLGGIARFIGKLSDDELGNVFKTELERSGVETIFFTSPTPTGRVLSIITPDAQRSMLTYLGASSEMSPVEISEKHFEDAAIVHIEGYLIFNRDLLLKILQSAKAAGALISLDLASFTVVKQEKDFLDNIAMEYVDILIANEDEAEVFTGHVDEMKALASLAEKSEIAVLKVGKRGSYISRGGDVVTVSPKGSGDAVDTTGAGDLWAAGFLFGLVSGFTLEKAGEIGSACGYEVCQTIGTHIPDDGWDRIKSIL